MVLEEKEEHDGVPGGVDRVRIVSDVHHIAREQSLQGMVGHYHHTLPHFVVYIRQHRRIQNAADEK